MHKQFFLIAVLLIATLQTPGLTQSPLDISSNNLQTSRLRVSTPNASKPCPTSVQGFITPLPLAMERLEMQPIPRPEAFNAKPCPIPLAARGNNVSMSSVIIRHKR
jgi:hypothetical protein